LEYHDLPIDDPKVRKPDASKAKAVLGWEAKVPFHEGIRTTINYFMGVLGEEAKCRLKD
jgi:nucleoside-diphosphate-sugar epimerase